MLKFVRLSLVAVLVTIAITFATGAGAAPPGSASYIVVLNGNAGPPSWVASELSSRFGGSVSHVYSHALSGFALTLPPQAAQALARDPRVAFVEADGVVTADTTQSNATWGLDRVDQRALPLSGTFAYTRTGAGVKAYIIDTGIRFTHTQFGGRAIKGVDEVTANGTAADCHGHGTHVAGTVGGSTYGVAKGVTLVAVRVLNCNGSGTTSGVIAGVDWVTGNHAAGQPAVANMSLGGGASSALDTAVRNSIADGISYAIAAGNGNVFGVAQNACTTSPARVAEAMTVSATSNTDTKASWANYGSCVDWFAPGVGITSAWYTSNTATNTISGTSMATPHTTGVAALYLQGNPSASPATVRTALFYNSTKNFFMGPGSGCPNALLFTPYSPLSGRGGLLAAPAPLVLDLAEPDHRDGVVRCDLAVVELTEEGRHVLGAANLRIVVLDLARGELAERLHLDLVDDGVEDAVTQAEACACEHLHDHPLPVFRRLVAQANRRRLATAPQLLGDDRGVEVQCIHGVRHVALFQRVRRRIKNAVTIPSTQPVMALMMTSQISAALVWPKT